MAHDILTRFTNLGCCTFWLQ